jgi:hypothetical protein
MLHAGDGLSMSHDVFICYSARDRTIANTVCAVLEAEGVRCWIAPRDILPGADWGESIIDSINDAKAMVLVFSSNANEAQSQIKREVERAVNKGIPVIPLRTENVLPTKALEYFLSTPHWLDAFEPPLDEHVRQLAYSIKQLLGKQTGERPQLTTPPQGMRPTSQGMRPTPHPQSGSSLPLDAEGALAWAKKPMHAAILGVLVLILALGAWWLLRPTATPEDQQAWNVAATEDIIPAYALYLRQEPQGYYRSQATDRTAELKTQVDQAFAKAKATNTAAAYQSFMETYGKQGLDLEEARDAYANADAQENGVRNAYRQALGARDRAAYQSFLTQYGSSSYAGDVRRRLAACHTETQQSGGVQSTELSRSGSGTANNSNDACSEARSNAQNSAVSECTQTQGRSAGVRVLSQNAQNSTSVGGKVAGSLLGGALFGGRSVNLGSSYECTAEVQVTCQKTTTSSRQVDICP